MNKYDIFFIHQGDRPYISIQAKSFTVSDSCYWFYDLNSEIIFSVPICNVLYLRVI